MTANRVKTCQVFSLIVMESNAPPEVETPANPATPARKSLGRDVIETIILIVVTVTLSQMLLANYVIEQRSAEPNFYQGQRVFVDKVVFRLTGLHRGDVVVVHPQTDGEDLFKRVIGLPGDTIDIQSNQVFINGQPLHENYLAPGADTMRGLRPGILPRTLTENEYFLMGDNRSFSQDSRYFGPFQQDKLVGRVWLLYWPLNTFTLVQGAAYESK